MGNSSLRSKYHMVFILKYRRQVIYEKIKADIERNLRELCEHKKVEVIGENA